MEVNITGDDIISKLNNRIGQDAQRIAALEAVVEKLQEKLKECTCKDEDIQSEPE